MSLEIESSDVIRLIQQFLSENNLTKTLNSLQEETGVTLNSVSSIDAFMSDVNAGHWDSVLQTLQHLRLSNRVVVDLYEQIALELIELREFGAARSIIRHTDPIHYLKQTFPERYLKLENLLTKTYFDPKQVYGEGLAKEKRRKQIATALSGEVNAVAPSRLLTLLGQSLKWQQLQGLLPPGSKLDLFKGRACMSESTEETFPTTLNVSVKFASGSHPRVLIFSPDGQYLISGSSDGFIEIWNYMTGKLRKDLQYQAQDNFMLMEDPVSALAFHTDSEIFASGSTAGKIKIWRISSGQCSRRLEQAHSKSINSLLFSRDGTQLYSGSIDFLIRLHSLKSGVILKEFIGHSSYINSLGYTFDNHLVSASSDGSIKIWSTKSGECLSTITARVFGIDSHLPINCLMVRPSIEDCYIVCYRSLELIVLNKQGQIVKSFCNTETSENNDFILATLSPSGNWVYAATQNGHVQCLNLTAAEFQHNFKAHDMQVFSIVHHPCQNILATASQDGSIHIWK